MPESYIYLDYAATAPLCEEAHEALLPYLTPGRNSVLTDANANTLYGPGRDAFAALEDARGTVARGVGARPDEIIFTSCASEADTAAILGIARAGAEKRHLLVKKRTPQVIISAIEHDAVKKPAQRLTYEGFRVDVAQVDKGGFVSPETLAKLMTEDCVLVSIQAANSEIGTIQDISALASIAHKGGALFHTDATQALGKLSCNVKQWGVDAATFSGHKIGAPKGVGFLYLKARTPFEDLVQGGGQEQGRRSGTQNVAGARACAAAVKAAVELEAGESARLRALRDKLYVQLTTYPKVEATVSVPKGSMDYLPNVVNVYVKGMENSTLVLRFDQAGFCVSGGSACSSASLDPSPTLVAVGVPGNYAQGELRISMGRYTTEEDIDAFLMAFPQVIGA